VVEGGLDCLRRAAAEAEALGDGPLQARALTELGTARIHAVRGLDDEAGAHLHRALQEPGYVDALAGRRHDALICLNQPLGRRRSGRGAAGAEPHSAPDPR
jgi:hypothetical protein